MWRTVVWLLMIVASPVLLWVATGLAWKVQHPLIFSAAFAGAVVFPFVGVRELIRDYSAGRLGRASIAASTLVVLVAGAVASLVLVALLIVTGGIRWFRP